MIGSYLSSTICYWRHAFVSFQIVNISFNNSGRNKTEEEEEEEEEEERGRTKSKMMMMNERYIRPHRPHFCFYFRPH